MYSKKDQRLKNNQFNYKEKKRKEHGKRRKCDNKKKRKKKKKKEGKKGDSLCHSKSYDEREVPKATEQLTEGTPPRE